MWLRATYSDTPHIPDHQKPILLSPHPSSKSLHLVVIIKCLLMWLHKGTQCGSAPWKMMSSANFWTHCWLSDCSSWSPTLLGLVPVSGDRSLWVGTLSYIQNLSDVLSYVPLQAQRTDKAFCNPSGWLIEICFSSPWDLSYLRKWTQTLWDP